MSLKRKFDDYQESSLKLSIVCGGIGLLGCISVIVTDIIGIIVVDNHNPISETISSLAITEYAWIQDSGLDLFAAAFAACAVGLFSLNLGGWKWQTGTSMLLLLAIDIFLIAEHNKYAGREDVVGAAIHIYCVYALGILFSLAPFLLSFGLRKLRGNRHLYSLGTAITWAVLAPIFFFIPNGWDGAYERALSLIVIAWVAVISWMLVKEGRGQLERKHASSA